MVQLATVLISTWLCGLVCSQFGPRVPGYGQLQVQRYGQAGVLGYGQSQLIGLGQSKVARYGQSQLAGYGHFNVLGNGQSQFRGYGHSQLQYGQLQRLGYGQPQLQYGQLQRPGYGQVQGPGYGHLQGPGYGQLKGPEYTQIQVQLPGSGQNGQSQFIKSGQLQSQAPEVLKIIPKEEKLEQRIVLTNENTAKLEDLEIIEKNVIAKEALKYAEDIEQETKTAKTEQVATFQKTKSKYLEEAEIFLQKFRQREISEPLTVAFPKTSNVKITEENQYLGQAEKSLNNIKEKPLSPPENSVANQNTKTEKLDQSQIQDILIENINTKDGLKEIIKKLLKDKLDIN